jgi:NAD(P)H-dependent flavin oxidoreductase YrpB (nitropropane dioxygenase family)
VLVTRLDLPAPVLAAPMAGGPTTTALVRAAAAAGSLGFVPAGYRTAVQLADDLAEVRSATDSFGVNLFVPDSGPVDRVAVMRYRDAIAAEVASLGTELGGERLQDDDEWDAKVDLLVREPVAWVSFTFGLPDASTVRRLRAAGSRLLMTVTDVDEARAAADLRPDGLVVQSAAAGGHRATFDQRRTPDTEELKDLVGAISAAVDLPVIAAGGAADRDAVRCALEAGAEAVAVGTALLLADEAGTRPTHRSALADPASTTTTMRAYTGRVARGIRTAFADRYEHLAPAAYPAVHHLTAPMRRWAAAHDDRDHLHLWAGTGFRSARTGPAGELLAELMP